jgi:phospholysine phosphohistidine inorganic pyrophosphate phosphatase
MNALLFDMDGVLYEGERPIAGAVDSIAWCRAQAIPHLFLTNTTSRSRQALVDKLAILGLNVSAAEILSPPVAARSWLQQNISGPVALFVRKQTASEFNGLEIATPEATDVAAVVLGDLGEEWSFARYNRAFRLLMDNPDAVLIALGMTRFWRAEDGLRLDAGPFVRGLEYATGREAVVMGKPAVPFFKSALALLDARADETLMIGDDIRGDIGGAQQAGIKAVLVRSGKFRPADLEQGITPFALLDSVASLPAWWHQQGW